MVCHCLLPSWECSFLTLLAAGVVAIGTVMTDPADIPEDKAMKRFFLVPKHFNSAALRVVVRIDHVLPRRLEKAALASNPGLWNLTIIKQPIGTNFKVSKAEAVIIESMLQQVCRFNTEPPNDIRG
jgi:hypothetical protein